MKKSTKTAVAGGFVGTGITGGSFVGITAGLTGSAANLGGYATAQIVAGGLGGTFAGPALATMIVTIGGPFVAGGIVALGTGVFIFGGIKFITRLWR